MAQPLIGISLDAEEQGEYSDFPYYALRQNYAASVSKAGGVPLHLAYDVAAVERYAELLDGLVLTGGAFDIPPSMYGEANVHDTVVVKEGRTAFEWAITEAMMKRNKPVLGICGGMQLLAVMLGGSLIQHIPDEVPNALPHEVKDRLNPAHSVAVKENSLLHKIVKVSEFGVNTSHHQAVKGLPSHLLASAHATDGVIEAIEHVDYPFCLGVQWHPEYQVQQQDSEIMKAFIEACL